MKGFLILLALAAVSPVHAQRVLSVNFFQEGEVSKLAIETDKPVSAERFHIKDDKQIILDLKNVKIDPKLLRGIDTSEFDGATVYVSGYPRPGAKDDLRFAVQLRDNVRSLLETSGNRIVLNIENRFGVFPRSRVEQTEASSAPLSVVAADAAGTGGARINVPRSTGLEDILENLTLSGPKKYVGKRISLNVKDIPLKDLLGMIADTSGFNIIIDAAADKVPPLTLSLTNIPWDQALDTVMALSKLVATKNANILTITTLDQATLESEARARAEQLKIGLEPLVTKIFPINYAEIPSLTTIIMDYLSREPMQTPPGGVGAPATLGPVRGTLQSDMRTNSLVVRDTADSIERIRKIIEVLDTQTPQILIEAKVVEASEGQSKRIGLTNGIAFGYDPLRNTSALVPAGPGFSFSSAGRAANDGSLAPRGGGQTFGFNITGFKRLANLSMALELMESQSKARIVTAPKVITQNKKPATITSTETANFQVIQTTAAGTITTFQQLPVSLNLSVTPQVTNEGSINLDVSLTSGAFGPQENAAVPPTTVVRALRTNVLVDNGSTVVLGGLYKTTHGESHQGIPYLKDLPLVGWLFRTPHNPTTSRSELLVFLTPRIINQEEAGMVNRGASASTTP